VVYFFLIKTTISSTTAIAARITAMYRMSRTVLNVSVDVFTFPMVPCRVVTVPLRVVTVPESVETALWREVTAELTELIELLRPLIWPETLVPKLEIAEFTPVNPVFIEDWSPDTAVPTLPTAVLSVDKELVIDAKPEAWLVDRVPREVCMALTVVVRLLTLLDRLVNED
jgi:hypothetical protein